MKGLFSTVLSPACIPASQYIFRNWAPLYVPLPVWLHYYLLNTSGFIFLCFSSPPAIHLRFQIISQRIAKHATKTDLPQPRWRQAVLPFPHPQAQYCWNPWNADIKHTSVSTTPCLSAATCFCLPASHSPPHPGILHTEITGWHPSLLNPVKSLYLLWAERLGPMIQNQPVLGSESRVCRVLDFLILHGFACIVLQGWNGPPAAVGGSNIVGSRHDSPRLWKNRRKEGLQLLYYRSITWAHGNSILAGAEGLEFHYSLWIGTGSPG